MPNVQLEFVLHIISVLGSALTVIKLYGTGLYRRYLFFFCYCLFRIPNFAWPLFIPDVGSLQYRRMWSITEPVAWVFQILVVFELYSLVLKDHRGLYTIGRWAMYAATTISVALSLLALIPNLRPGMPEYRRRINYELAAGRGIELSLVLFILLMLFFLSRYPIKLSRNLAVHASLYSIYFLSTSFELILRTILDVRIGAAANVSMDAISSICSVAWFLLLSPKGEEVQANLPIFGPEREQRALRQLEALNATLLKVSRN
jgi:hypothetical protein